MDLLIIAALSLLLIPLVIFTSGAIRIVLGLVFVLFFPGYVLVAAFFPKRTDLSNIERVALSFGLSIAVVPLIGLGLNYSPWGIHPYPMLVSMLLFIFIVTAVAWYRRRKLALIDRFQVRLQPWLHSIRESLAQQKRLDRILTIVLVLAILGALGSLSYVIVVPKPSETFTEFYVLGPGGAAENYPKELAVGETGNVTIGIINHEHAQISYRVRVMVDNEENKEVGPILLNDGEKWENTDAFVLTQAGDNQSVDFQLFKGEETGSPADSLHLLINVTK